MNLLQSVPFGVAELRRCHEPASACPLRKEGVSTSADENSRLRCLDIGPRESVAERLRGCLSNADDMKTLRRIVLEENLMSFQMNDLQVVEQVAALVARRALCVVGALPTRPVSPAREGGFASRPTGTPSRPPAVATARVTEPAPPRTGPRPAPAAPVVEEGDMAAADPAPQATVLKDAARDGVPFCEVCEKARHEREEAAAHASSRPQ